MEMFAFFVLYGFKYMVVSLFQVVSMVMARPPSGIG